MITPEPITHKEREDTNKSFFDDESVLPQDRAKVNDPIQGIDKVTVQPTGNRTSKDILREMFSYSPPKPTYDPNRPEELKRLARASALGKGLNVVGDIIGLGAGANVKRRQPDNRELGYLDSMYRYIDDYNRRMDDWNWKDYMNRLRGKETELGLLEKEKDREIRDRMFQADQIWKQLGFQSEQAYKNFQMEKAGKDQELAEKKYEADVDYKNMTAKERERHNRQMELASMIRAQKTGQSSTSKNFTVYDSAGKPIQLGENEREKILSLILSDPNTKLTETEMDLLSPAMGEPVSTNTMNTLVQKYWDKIPSSRDYIQKKYGTGQSTPSSQSNWGEYFRPRYEGPVRPQSETQQTLPQQQVPQTPVQKNVVETPQTPAQTSNVVNDSIKIRDTYNKLGVDITQGDDYQNALQVAIKQGIVNPNSQLTRDQANKVNELMQQIKQDKELIRAAGVSEGVGFTPTRQDTQQTQTEVPLFFQ